MTMKAYRVTTRGLAALLYSTAWASVAAAQTTTTAPASEVIGQVTVTGSRIIRDGYQAPTPVTVINADTIDGLKTSATIADVLTTLPVFAVSTTPSYNNTVISTGLQGINSLNLRGAGPVRTLVMLDGQRLSPAIGAGNVDVNNIPQQLISRVDVVTGGASAVYGSDAITGVVNFILDKKFTGFKSEAAFGQTSYSDNKQTSFSATFGTPFAGERGHFLASASYDKSEGIFNGNGGRDWAKNATWAILQNPTYTATNGQPFFFLARQAGVNGATEGGIIYSGPLRGTAFGPGGVPYQFVYGDVVTGAFQNGGAAQPTQKRYGPGGASMEPPLLRHAFFTRASYDVTDSVNAYVQASYTDSKSSSRSLQSQYVANNAGPTLRSGNPFIPASVQAQMTALNLQSFTLGTFNDDIGVITGYQKRAQWRVSGGFDGEFDAFDTDWKWNAFVGYSKAKNDNEGKQNLSPIRYFRAINAVRDPNGQIVCADTLSADLAVRAAAAGCVPYNPMGIGVNSRDAINYVAPPQGAYRLDQTKETVAGATLTGEPFELWAGPVGVALNFEHRKNTLLIEGDPIGALNQWFSLNTGVRSAGTNSVNEGALEVAIPLVKDKALLKDWDVDLAYRGTDYKYSGFVSTWKAGTTFSPVEDIRFRITRSRDIRAPTLSDLFLSGTFTSAGTALDPTTGTQVAVASLLNPGNLNLTPEIGDTTEFGVVLQPRFLPGFSASVDYWNIDITDAIGALSLNQVLNLCFVGNAAACANVQRGPSGQLIRVDAPQLNLASQTLRGVDIAANYRFPLANIGKSLPGDLDLGVTATHYITSEIDPGIPGSPLIENVGQMGGPAPIFQNNGPPKWGVVTRLAYALDRTQFTLTGRYRSGGVSDNSYIQCTSNCPASTTDHPTIDKNDNVPSAYWLDLGVLHKFDVRSGEVEAFLNIRNLLNRDPPLIPIGPGGNWYVRDATSPDAYDQLGRVYRVGLRVKM